MDLPTDVFAVGGTNIGWGTNIDRDGRDMNRIRVCVMTVVI